MQISLAFSAYYVLLVLPLVACSSHEDHQFNHIISHKNTKENNFHKLSPQMIFNVTVHGILLWFSMGFLMPIGILVIRMSVKEEKGTTKAKVLFYFHVIFQILSVLLATAGAVMSVRNFENSFDNSHQRLGLALYVAIWVQALIGLFRPHRGKKERSVWYMVHWMLGTVISVVGILNIYTGVNAYHKRTKRSSWLWSLLFTVEMCVIGVYYLYQDKRDYIQNQGVELDNDFSLAARQLDLELAQRQKDLMPQQPSDRQNALKNLFDQHGSLFDHFKSPCPHFPLLFF